MGYLIGSLQVLPDAPTSTDDGAVLLWALSALVVVVGLLWHRNNALSDRYTSRLERTADEQTGLMREATALIKQDAADAARRDGETAALLREVLGELRNQARPTDRRARQ